MKRSQAGTRVECPSCNATLTVPETLAAESLFDDLFDAPDPEPSVSPASEPPDNLSAEPAEEVFKPEELAAPVAKPDPDPFDAQDDKAKPATEETLEPFDPLGNVAETKQPVASDALEELELDPGGDDPFEYNESKPLRVDGISPVVVANDAFFMKCPVCDSDLQTNKRELGNKVVCTDCHSEITIVEPKKKKQRQDVWRKAAEVKTPNDSDDDFKLEDPVQRPAPDVPLGADVGLDSVAGDLLAPQLPVENDDVVHSGTNPQSPARKKQKPNRPAPEQRPAAATGNRKPGFSEASGTASTQPKPAPKKKKSVSQVDGEDLPPTLNQIPKLDLKGDVDLMIRTAVAIVFLTFSYTMFDSVWATLGMTELNGGDRFVRYFPAAIGGFICFAVVVWFMSVTMSVLTRSVANGDKKVQEWVGFAPSEWLGSFVAFAFAGWASSVPGGMIGYIMMKLTGVFFLLPLGLAISAFAILPLFFISSFYNESAFNIFAPDILQTITTAPDKWKSAYISYAILLGAFAVGILILFIPSLIFSFLGAAIQIVVLSAFAIMIGLHANSIIKTIV